MSGVAAAGSVGTATASGSTVVNATANISGVAATAAVGATSQAGSASVSLSGTQATGQSGSSAQSGNAIAGVTSASATGFVGQLVASAVADITITAARANLIYELALLHGLVQGAPLSVSPTQRTAGNLVQTISGTDTVTITTVASDTLQGSVDTWIDALAAIHGLTSPLVVTATGRSSGAITQALGSTGDTATVVTL
ncbi:MAG: hypothetical protein CGW95_15040 [Phenylobacterium zucineum]|nr:MAG: hypothetical protein CGW95_15040 [Phenylobacterium zucineum]